MREAAQSPRKAGVPPARLRLILWVMAAAALAACGPGSPAPPPAGSFAFGVFGDGPYFPWEEGPFERLIEDVNRADLAWFLHVGDILYGACSDDAYGRRLRQVNTIRHAVVYTPGDNEWTDCHAGGGGYDPLDRLATVRRVFFADPDRSLGARPMSLTSQAGDSAYRGFPENVRWSTGGFVVATVHLVGSSNGLESYPGRTVASDLEVDERTAAAVAWLEETFAVARRDAASGVIVAMHGNVGLAPQDSRRGYYDFVLALERQVAGYDRPILLIHGDSHTYLVDHPLVRPDGSPYEHFTRLETPGSPTIGWVRVVVDTVNGAFAGFEPRRMRGWW